MKNLSIENLLEAATVYFSKKFRPGFRSAARAFLVLKKNEVTKNKPFQLSRAAIAKFTDGYSEETIKDFIEFAAKHGMIDAFQYKKKDGINLPNFYLVNQFFFEFMVLMESLGWLNDPLKYKEFILDGLSKDPNFLCSKLLQKRGLSTMELPAVFPRELPTLKSYLRDIQKYRSNQQTRNSINEIKSRKGFGVIQGVPLSFAEKEKLTDNFPPKVLKRVGQEYRAFTEHNRIDKPMGFCYAAGMRLMGFMVGDYYGRRTNRQGAVK